MSKMKRLADHYETHIGIPWRDAAAAQRVIFCVYHESDELKLRAKIGEFELATQRKSHRWLHFDITDTFPEWLSKQKYATSYYQNPPLLSSLMPKYGEYLCQCIVEFVEKNEADDNTVVALSGVASLFGLVKVKDVVEKVATKVAGRLLVFFPGRYEHNDFRLLDGYDGWDYHAFVITADKEL